MSVFRDVLVLCYLKTEKVSRTECGRNPGPLAVSPRPPCFIYLLLNKLMDKQMDFYKIWNRSGVTWSQMGGP